MLYQARLDCGQKNTAACNFRFYMLALVKQTRDLVQLLVLCILSKHSIVGSLQRAVLTVLLKTVEGTAYIDASKT